MKVLATLTLFLALACPLKHGNETGDARKHYGLSHSSECNDYFKTFKCMSACKSIGFQIYRMDHRCKCTCHDIKTSTILPFFKWGTNGTTRKIHETVSPQLYHIVGTLSPKSTSTVKSTTIESDENEESDDDASNETEDLITDTDKDDNEHNQSDEDKLSNKTDDLNTDAPPDDNENEQNDNVEDEEQTGVTKEEDTKQKGTTSTDTRSSTITSTTDSTSQGSTLPGN